MGKEISGKCPNCGFKLFVEEDGSTVCPKCDETILASELVIDKNTSANMLNGDIRDIKESVGKFAQYIDTPSAGMAYLENFIDTNDWSDYEQSIFFDLPELETAIAKNKVTHADSPQTWELEFKTWSKALQFKLNGLKTLEAKAVDAYDFVDSTNALVYLDGYNALARAIKEKDGLLKVLETDIRLFEKYGGEPAKAKKMRSELKNLQTDVEWVFVLTCIEDLSGIKQLIENRNQAISDELAENGIDAEGTYVNAVNAFESSQINNTGIGLFEKLGGYKDSQKYIKKINSYNKMFDKLYETNNRLYYIEYSRPRAFDPKQQGEEEDKTLQTGGFSLFSINEGRKAEKPVVKGITRFLDVYDGKVFFILNDSKIGCLNTFNNNTDIIDEAKRNDYGGVIGGTAPLTSDGASKPLKLGSDRLLFIKYNHVAIVQAKKGCFGKPKKAKKDKKGEIKTENKNNAKLVVLDMQNNTFNVISEIVDVMDVFDNMVFFTQNRPVQHRAKDKRGKEVISIEYKDYFSCLNTDTMQCEDILNAHVQILGAKKGKVVYFEFNPSTFNNNLFVYDANERTTTLIEENVYDFYGIIRDKIFYKVGALNHYAVASVNFDGSDRVEIAQDLDKYVDVIGDWLYFVKGDYRNKTLIKISSDGKRVVLVASRIKFLYDKKSSVSYPAFLRIDANYVYYINTNNDLYMVRTDGKGCRKLVDRVVSGDDIVLDQNNIYVCRNELYGTISDKPYYASALYKMSRDGNKITKLCFDIDGIYKQDDEDDRIFIKATRNVKYKITAPDDKGIMVSHYERHNVELYSVMSKRTGEIREVLRLGDPSTKSFKVKKGCFRKAKDVESIIEIVPEDVNFYRTGKMKSGQMRENDEREAAAASSAANAPRSNSAASSAGQNNGGVNGGDGKNVIRFLLTFFLGFLGSVIINHSSLKPRGWKSRSWLYLFVSIITFDLYGFIASICNLFFDASKAKNFGYKKD